MKHEVTSLNTKKTISATLKKLLKEKTLSKITVSEIVAVCGINRKTFYYHFQDISDLLKWTFEEETVAVLNQFDMILEYEDAINFIFDYIENNKHILNCVYDTLGRDELRRFLYQDFIGIMENIINRIEEMENIKADENYKQFLCDFYTEAIAGGLIRILKSRKEIDRNTLIEYVSRTLRLSLPVLLRDSIVK